ncbi:MAG: ABC transporter permease [Oscillospiraceae bacterium]|nr:ABC transporter permease [Oscillospiraceae bacterium]
MFAQFLTPEYIIAFINSILRMSSPLIFCAMGALIADHAGTMNMALEGIMLAASFSAVVFSALTSSVWGGILGAIIGGIIISALLAYLHLFKESDLIITGITLNTMASGGTIYLLFLLTGEKGTSRLLQSLTVPTLKIPILCDIPVLGEILSGHNVLTYMAFVCVLITFVVMFKSRLGLRIRAVGHNPNAAASVGINVRKVKFTALMLSGICASFGGAFMSMGYLSYFAKDMLAGRGFIGISAATLAGGQPFGTLLAALGFGTANAASITLATLNLQADLVAMLPYLATVLGLVIVSARKMAKEKRREQAAD